MGNSLRTLIDGWFVGPADTQTNIMMLGIDNAGKTSILYRLKLGEVITTVPTVGFTIDTLEYKSLKFTVWDVCGQTKFRPLWRHYFEETDAIIFVIDSCDTDERLEEARLELYSMLDEPELRECPLLVFANKQDLEQARPASELAAKLALHSFVADRKVRVVPSSVVTCEGLHDGLNWISEEIQFLRKKRELALYS